MSSMSRADRRKAQREEERRRSEESERALEEPQPMPFEAPAAGKIVESRPPPAVKPKRPPRSSGR